MAEVSGDKQKIEAKLMKRPARSSRWPVKVGAVITAVWCAGVLWYIVRFWGSVSSLDPNALGDFFAGAFAPLAFLWLVLGFWQQGEELRNSADALWLQGEELQNSVEQQRQLVEVTREQLQHESNALAEQREEIKRNAQPVLQLQRGGSAGIDSTNTRYFFSVRNVGKSCTAVTVRAMDQIVTTQASLDRGASLRFELTLPFRGPFDPFEVCIDYLDDRSLEGRTSFEISGEAPNFDIVQKSYGEPKPT